MMKMIPLGLFFLGMAYAGAADVVVVSGERFRYDSLSADEIRLVYTGKRFRFGDEKIVLLNLEPENPMREWFEQNILHQRRDTLAKNWLQAHYLGHKPPKVFKSTESVAEFLTKVDNSIGYTDEATARKYHLKILYRMSDQQ